MTLLHSTESLRAMEAAHHLHPFTEAGALNAQGARRMTHADGVHLTDSDGNRILDGMAGLWCGAIGYGRPEIADAVAGQLRQLPFCTTFFRTSHLPVIELGHLLAQVTPDHINRFFFTGSGSDANDTIFRMIAQDWAMMGQPDRTMIVSRQGAYHGSTVAASAVGGFGFMDAQPGLPVGNILHAPRPAWWAEGGDLSPEAFGLKVARDTLALTDGIGAQRVEGVIAEPIMGARGVIIPPGTYWLALSAGLTERSGMLISDEVICGIGRTGSWFGCQTYGTTPDVMTMAKGLTSGNIPMGAVGVSDRVAEVLSAKGGEFAHGHTCSGHPAAPAAAIADLGVGMTCREHAFANGLIMRVVGDRMVVSPPLVLTHAEADERVETAWRVLDLTQAQLGRPS